MPDNGMTIIKTGISSTVGKILLAIASSASQAALAGTASRKDPA